MTGLIPNREGRLLIDYLRNGRGNTAVGAYSPRARPRFPVSMPVGWLQVARGIRADARAEAPSLHRRAARFSGVLRPVLQGSDARRHDHAARAARL